MFFTVKNSELRGEIDTGLNVKLPVIVVRLKERLECTDKLLNIKLHKNQFCGSGVVKRGRTDGQTRWKFDTFGCKRAGGGGCRVTYPDPEVRSNRAVQCRIVCFSARHGLRMRILSVKWGLIVQSSSTVPCDVPAAQRGWFRSGRTRLPVGRWHLASNGRHAWCPSSR